MGIFVSSFWLFKHRICAILSKIQNKLTLGWAALNFQFASISFGFELIRILSVTGGWSMTIKQMREITNQKLFTQACVILHPCCCLILYILLNHCIVSIGKWNSFLNPTLNVTVTELNSNASSFR